MHKYFIGFEKETDVIEFVGKMNKFDCEMDLKSGNRLVDAKSLLGVMAISGAPEIQLHIYQEACDDVVASVKSYIQ